MTETIVADCRGIATGYTDRPVLENVDLRVARGEIVTVLGRSGSGKSTLLKCLGGLLPPLGGTIELFGQELYATSGEERHRLMHRVGMLFQSDALFASMTILDNVMLPLVEVTDLPRPLAKELALAKLALVGVGSLAHRFPSALSGGQRKRAALARAMVLDPELLLCDEPSSGLDPYTAARLDETLLALRDANQVAVVAVTHDVASVRMIADRGLVLAEGGISLTGTVEELERSTRREAAFFFHPVEAAAPNGAA